MRVLVAEDDVRLAALLRETLEEAGWRGGVANDGRTAFDRLLSDTGYDVALLDWMLPGMDGISVARRLRDLGVAVPILMLTARGDVRDRIDGLDAGADDYLPKPFDLDELLARLRALYRRSSFRGESPARVGDLVVDPVARQVSRGARGRAAPGARGGGGGWCVLFSPPPLFRHPVSAGFPCRAGRHASHHPGR